MKPRYSKFRRPFSSVEELVVTGTELLNGCNNNSGMITSGWRSRILSLILYHIRSEQGSGYKLEIVATAHGIEDVSLSTLTQAKGGLIQQPMHR